MRPDSDLFQPDRAARSNRRATRDLVDGARVGETFADIDAHYGAVRLRGGNSCSNDADDLARLLRVPHHMTQLTQMTQHPDQRATFGRSATLTRPSWLVNESVRSLLWAWATPKIR